MLIRPATPADAPAVAAIYAPHVLHGTASFEEAPPDVAEMARRMERVLAPGWPWLVAEDGGEVVGYAYAAQLNLRSGYRYACENSIYVAAGRAGQGIGTSLLDRLVADCVLAGFRRMFAVIGDSANAASIRLHARAGFVHAGTLAAAGFKHGRWLDVVHMARTIAPAGPGLPPLPDDPPAAPAPLPPQTDASLRP